MASNQERLASELHEFSIPPDRAAEIAAWIANVKPPILMSDLPIPDIGEISGIADWRVNSWDVSVYPDSNGHPAMIHIENRTRMTKPYVFNSRKAREFGEAMIAAANHAEQEQDNE